ncbi:MAG: glycosyltransferase [Treponema sp.]|nr:glycosyltransferase [Treponema sp.]
MLYLYTLTSTPNDLYYEQFLLSAFSLKKIMPNADIILLCDSATKDTLVNNRNEHSKYIKETISVDVPAGFSQVEISRWVRTSMRCLVKGDFLFLDGDTIVTDDLSSIANLNIKFASCLDKHLLLDSHPKKNSIIKKDKKLKFDSHKSNTHYNGGVLFCADTPEVHKIFDRWHELWLYSKSKKTVRDQPALNMAIQENLSSFTELDGSWNCQIAHNGLPWLSCSKIIHYFATDMVFNESPFLLGQNEIFKEIKRTGVINEQTIALLNNPRGAFALKSQIIAGKDMLYVVNSSLFQFLFLVKKRLPFIYYFYNSIFTFVKNVLKSIIIKFNKKSKKANLIYN